MLIDFLKAIIFGIIEGVCEWLPVSSTGHIILLGEHMAFDSVSLMGEEFAAAFREMFDFVIQLGAISAVGVMFWQRFNVFSRKKSSEERREIYLLAGKLMVASAPAAVVGILGDELLEHITGKDIDGLFYNSAVVAIMLIVYGILFIIVERLCKGEGKSRVTWRSAFIIGCFQSLSVIPGTSRSGATILGARILGIDRTAAAEFSFFMGVPAILGASLLKGYKFSEYVAESGASVPFAAWSVLLVASLTAFCVSVLTIKALLGFVKKHSFAPFGVYRILLGVVVLWSRCG